MDGDMRNIQDKMKLYRERWGKVREEFKEFLKTPESNIRANRRFLLARREGDFLIKTGKNSKQHIPHQSYVDFTYNADGWWTGGPRKEAQWFTGKEAHEFIRTHKGFHIVRK